MNRERILDYLYDEMTPDLREEFERELRNNAKLQSELRELQEVRSFLSHSTDQVAQPIEMVVKPVTPVRRISRWWAIAASLLLLIAAGKMLDLKVRSQGSGLVIGFGDLEQPDQSINDDLKVQYAQLQGAIQSLQEQLNSYGAPGGDTDVKPVSLSENQKLAGWIVNAMKQEQTSLESRLANKILEDQQVYIQGVAQDLMNYWNEQRKNDLQMINNGMQQLVQALQLPSQDLAQFVNNTQQNY